MNAGKIDIATLIRTGNIVRIPTPTFHEYIVASAEFFREMDALRMGQAYSITLKVLRPDIAEVIKGTESDAFYDNDKLPAMLAIVYKKW